VTAYRGATSVTSAGGRGYQSPSRALWADAEAVGRDRVMSKAFEISAGGTNVRCLSSAGI
jgi:hypothetical protein